MERKPGDKQDSIFTHNLNEYPKELHKKVTLLHHFKSYLEGDARGTTPTVSILDIIFGIIKLWSNASINIYISIMLLY